MHEFQFTILSLTNLRIKNNGMNTVFLLLHQVEVCKTILETLYVQTYNILFAKKCPKSFYPIVVKMK